MQHRSWQFSNCTVFPVRSRLADIAIAALAIGCSGPGGRAADPPGSGLAEWLPSYDSLGIVPVDLHESALWRRGGVDPGRLGIAGHRLFVLNPYGAPHIFVLNKLTGALECAFGADGGGPGEFRYPESIAAEGESGRLWIGDPNQPRISRD